jgi:hypothetical protein
MVADFSAHLDTNVSRLLVSAAVFGAPDTASADNCLTAPNSSAPQGSHWYYRVDRANQRKCWYFRVPGEPAPQATAQATSEAAPAAQSQLIPRLTNSSAGAPTSISPSEIAPLLPHTKMLAGKPNPAPVGNTGTDKLVQGSEQEGNAAPSTLVPPAPQASQSTQTSPQVDGPAPVPLAAWPVASPAVVRSNPQERIAVPIDARAGSVRPKADARASDDAESTARGGEPTTRARMAVSLIKPTPMKFLILGLGLAVIGILSRMVMKIAIARRARFNQRQDEWRDNQDEYNSVYERLSTARDFGPHQAFRAWHDAPAGTELSVSLSGLTGVNDARDCQ